jgi:hypothetical protein
LPRDNARQEIVIKLLRNFIEKRKGNDISLQRELHCDDFDGAIWIMV